MVVFQGREAPCGTVGISTETLTHKHQAVRLSRSASLVTAPVPTIGARACVCLCTSFCEGGSVRRWNSKEIGDRSHAVRCTERWNL